MNDQAVNELDFEAAPAASARPKTMTVLGLLAGTAAILSYLGSYAMANALVSAEFLKPWPPGHDPRPKWFAIGFVVLISLFVGVGVAFRLLSARHLKKIEAMELAEE
jgi:hypothetical protein